MVVVVAGKSMPLSKPMTAMICPIWAAMDGMAREKEKKDGKVGMGPGAVLVAAAGGKSRPGSKTMVTMIGLIGIGGSTIQFTVASTKHRPELRER